jgi:hypothetical protein
MCGIPVAAGMGGGILRKTGFASGLRTGPESEDSGREPEGERDRWRNRIPGTGEKISTLALRSEDSYTTFLLSAKNAITDCFCDS